MTLTASKLTSVTVASDTEHMKFWEKPKHFLCSLVPQEFRPNSFRGGQGSEEVELRNFLCSSVPETSNLFQGGGLGKSEEIKEFLKLLECMWEERKFLLLPVPKEFPPELKNEVAPHVLEFASAFFDQIIIRTEPNFVITVIQDHDMCLQWMNRHRSVLLSD